MPSPASLTPTGAAAFAAIAELLPAADPPADRPPRVLLVDADPLTAHESRQFLRRFNYAPVLAASPAEARTACELFTPDVIVTTTQFRPLPPPDYLADLLARCPNAALVVASASTDARFVDRLYAAGADLVLRHPYAQEELLARLRALTRRRTRWHGGVRPRPQSPDGRTTRARAAARPSATVLRLGDRVVDLDGAVVHGAAQSVRLTRNEVQLLRSLAACHGAPASREALLRAVWGESGPSRGRRVDTAVVALRRKIERRPDAPEHLVTVARVGYRLTQSAAPALDPGCPPERSGG